MLLNRADDVFFAGARVDRVYAGDTMVWPEVEVWSPWRLVLPAQVGGYPAPAAWFDPTVGNFDGGHQQVMWRYSSLGRIRYHGLMRVLTTFASGHSLIGCNLTDPRVPKPVMHSMSDGLGSPNVTALWAGAPARWSLNPHATFHHLLTYALPNAGVLDAGQWVSIDAIFVMGSQL